MVKEGVSDDSFTEILADNVDALEGRNAVVGYQTTMTAKQDATSNPFMPKFPKKSKGTAPEPKK